MQVIMNPSGCLNRDRSSDLVSPRSPGRHAVYTGHLYPPAGGRRHGGRAGHRRKGPLAAGAQHPDARSVRVLSHGAGRLRRVPGLPQHRAGQRRGAAVRARPARLGLSADRGLTATED